MKSTCPISSRRLLSDSDGIFSQLSSRWIAQRSILIHLHACDPRDRPGDEQVGNDCQDTGGEEFCRGDFHSWVWQWRFRTYAIVFLVRFLNVTKISDEPVLWSIGLRSYNHPSSSRSASKTLTPMLKKNRAAGI